MTATFSSFRIKRDQDGFAPRIEDDEGDVTELTATYDQLDSISEAIDEQLAFGDVDLEPDMRTKSRAKSSDQEEPPGPNGRGLRGDYVGQIVPLIGLTNFWPKLLSFRWRARQDSNLRPQA